MDDRWVDGWMDDRWVDGWMEDYLTGRGYFKPIWVFESILININIKNRTITIDQSLSKQNVSSSQP